MNKLVIVLGTSTVALAALTGYYATNSHKKTLARFRSQVRP